MTSELGHPVLGFLDFPAINILSRKFLFLQGLVLCIVEWLTESLAFIHQMPIKSPSCDKQNCVQALPNIPWWCWKKVYKLAHLETTNLDHRVPDDAIQTWRIAQRTQIILRKINTWLFYIWGCFSSQANQYSLCKRDNMCLPHDFLFLVTQKDYIFQISFYAGGDHVIKGLPTGTWAEAICHPDSDNSQWYMFLHTAFLLSVGL